MFFRTSATILLTNAIVLLGTYFLIRKWHNVQQEIRYNLIKQKDKREFAQIQEVGEDDHQTLKSWLILQN